MTAPVIPITRIACKARDLEEQLRLSLWWLSPEGEAWRREVHADLNKLLARNGRQQQEDK